MMVSMNPLIVDAVNTQIRLEFESAFLYLAFSGNLRQYGLPGMGHWMREQYREECGHALRFITYLENRRARVVIPMVSAPVYKWETPLDLFRLALEHERRITASIHDLLTLCREEREYATQCLLFDYVKEQVEEELQVEEIVDVMPLCGTRIDELLSLDQKLSGRSTKVWE
jgi:ferritin